MTSQGFAAELAKFKDPELARELVHAIGLLAPDGETTLKESDSQAGRVALYA